MEPSIPEDVVSSQRGTEPSIPEDVVSVQRGVEFLTSELEEKIRSERILQTIIAGHKQNEASLTVKNNIQQQEIRRLQDEVKDLQRQIRSERILQTIIAGHKQNEASLTVKNNIQQQEIQRLQDEVKDLQRQVEERDKKGQGTVDNVDERIQRHNLEMEELAAKLEASERRLREKEMELYLVVSRREHAEAELKLELDTRKDSSSSNEGEERVIKSFDGKPFKIKDLCHAHGPVYHVFKRYTREYKYGDKIKDNRPMLENQLKKLVDARKEAIDEIHLAETGMHSAVSSALTFETAVIGLFVTMFHWDHPISWALIHPIWYSAVCAFLWVIISKMITWFRYKIRKQVLDVFIWERYFYLGTCHGWCPVRRIGPTAGMFFYMIVYAIFVCVAFLTLVSQYAIEHVMTPRDVSSCSDAPLALRTVVDL